MALLEPLHRHHLHAGVDLDGSAVRLDLDTEARKVTPPPDLVTALKAAPPAWDSWQSLSYSHQREYADAVESAKKPETRQRRIVRAVRQLEAMPAKRGKASSITRS